MKMEGNCNRLVSI